MIDSIVGQKDIVEELGKKLEHILGSQTSIKKKKQMKGFLYPLDMGTRASMGPIHITLSVSIYVIQLEFGESSNFF